MTDRGATVLVDLGDFFIRPAVVADGVDEYLWRRDPETSRYDGSGGARVPLSDFLQRFREDLESPFATRRWFALVSDRGVHFGTIVLSSYAREAASAELGIAVGLPEFRDRGVGRRAVVGLLRHLWSSTPLRRVELHTFEWNERARRCFSHAGFRDVAHVIRGSETFLRMEARREWWLMWDGEGRFEFD